MSCRVVVAIVLRLMPRAVPCRAMPCRAVPCRRCRANPTTHDRHQALSSDKTSSIHKIENADTAAASWHGELWSWLVWKPARYLLFMVLALVITTLAVDAVIDTVVVTPPTAGAVSLPDSFESGFDEWATERFRREMAPSQKSAKIAPRAAADGSYYVYVNTSSPYPHTTYASSSGEDDVWNQKAHAAETEFSIYRHDDDSEVSSVSFAYHMYGDTLGTLLVQGSVDQGSTFSTVWSKNGNIGSGWQNATVNFDMLKQRPSVIKFKALAGVWLQSGVALDSVRVRGVTGASQAGNPTNDPSIRSQALHSIRPQDDSTNTTALEKDSTKAQPRMSEPTAQQRLIVDSTNQQYFVKPTTRRLAQCSYQYSYQYSYGCGEFSAQPKELCYLSLPTCGCTRTTPTCQHT